MNRIERIADWITACTIWLAILLTLGTLLIILGIGYTIIIAPLALYEFVRRKLRRS